MFADVLRPETATERLLLPPLLLPAPSATTVVVPADRFWAISTLIFPPLAPRAAALILKERKYVVPAASVGNG